MKKIFQVAVVAAAFAFFLAPSTAFGAETCTGACKAACTPPGESQSGTCTEAPNIGKACCVPAATTGVGTVTFSNPLNFTTVQGATGAFLNALQGIIVTLALVFLVFGGVLYVISAGDEGRIKTAKGAITAAMIGLAIGIAAPSFLKEVYGILGGTAAADCTGLTGSDLVACNATNATLTGGSSLGTILQNTLNFLLSMVGILAIIMLVIGGLMYFAAAGDEKRADTAKSIVKFAIIGIAVSLAALVIVTQIANFF